MHLQRLFTYILVAGFSLPTFLFPPVASPEEVIYHHELLPLFSSVTSQGGSGGMMGGVPSLFYNPAASVLPGNGVHIAAGELWSSAPLNNLVAAWGSAADKDERVIPMLIELDEEFEAGGFRAGFLSGVGRTGSGLNIGLMLVSDISMHGTYPQNLSGTFINQVSGHIGWTQRLRLFGSDWAVGAQVRPIIRTHSPVTGSDFFQHTSTGVQPTEDGLGSLPTLSGTALTLDAGVLWQYGPASLSMYGRNILSSPISYTINRFDTVRSGLLTDFGIPAGSEMDQAYIQEYLDNRVYRMPATIGIAAAYDLTIPRISEYLSPRLHAEYRIVFDDQDHDHREAIAAGMELTILDFLQLRGGLDGSRVTGGIGVRLWVLDASVSFYSMNLHPYNGSGESVRTEGMSIGLGIRL